MITVTKKKSIITIDIESETSKTSTELLDYVKSLHPNCSIKKFSAEKYFRYPFFCYELTYEITEEK